MILEQYPFFLFGKTEKNLPLVVLSLTPSLPVCAFFLEGKGGDFKQAGAKVQARQLCCDGTEGTKNCGNEQGSQARLGTARRTGPRVGMFMSFSVHVWR